ncbi:MAG: dienelactone hydrolase family protein [Paracoccaceae bacterium]|nr:dienelactone hydrolase family protein [Paracoccaceae bacterium]
MSETVQLRAADGHSFNAYRAGADDAAAPGLVVIQEIFGVNGHIRSVADRFAAQGFAAVAPALFDRIEPGIELGYGEADIARGRELKDVVATEDALADVAAAVTLLADEGRKVGVVGYCWGGSLAWATATRLDGVSAAVSYYGGHVPEWAGETPRCPVVLHFGAEDHAIPMEGVEAVGRAHPDLPIHIYPAGHGFSCDARGSYHAESAALALERTLAFLNENLA